MKAREAIENYDVLGSVPLIDLQNVLAVLIGPKAKAEITGKLASLGIREIVDLSLIELQHLGLSKVEAERVQAGCLMAKIFNKSPQIEKRPQLNTPDRAAAFVMEEMRNLKEEHFVVAYLDTKMRAFHKQTLFVGTANSCMVHARDVFREAVKRSAISIILYHNHPSSGDPTPSPDDLSLTETMIRAGETVGIPVADHIIIGDQSFISLKGHPYSYNGRNPFSIASNESSKESF